MTKLRHFLFGAKCLGITDHSSLEWMRRADISTKIGRWATLLQQLTYRVPWQQGDTNRVADFLSRNPAADDHGEIEELETLHLGGDPENLEISDDETEFCRLLNSIETMERERGCKSLTEEQLMKLHKQFLHCSNERLHNFLTKTSHGEDPATLQRARNLVCRLCQLSQKARPRPVASLPKDEERFNDTIMIDSLQYMGRSFLIIVEATFLLPLFAPRKIYTPTRRRYGGC